MLRAAGRRWAGLRPPRLLTVGSEDPPPPPTAVPFFFLPLYLPLFLIPLLKLCLTHASSRKPSWLAAPSQTLLAPAAQAAITPLLTPHNPPSLGSSPLVRSGDELGPSKRQHVYPDPSLDKTGVVGAVQGGQAGHADPVSGQPWASVLISLNFSLLICVQQDNNTHISRW